MQRRNFLQLLGLGGLSLAAPVPVFGQQGRGSTIWTPEQKAQLSGGHLVLVRKGFRPPTLAMEGAEFTKRTDAFCPGMPPVWGRRYLLDFQSDSRVAVSVFLEDGDDPSLAFYHAARKIQEDFRQKAIQEFSKLPEWERKGKQIVTLVDNPIFVGTLLDPTQHGFTVEVDYEQFFVPQCELDPGDFELYSETGECPIEIPTGIDFDRVLDMSPTSPVRIGRGLGKTRLSWSV